jgi:beta-glucosidase
MLLLDRLSVSYWEKAWVVESGVYTVRIAFSSEEKGEEVVGKFRIEKGFEWRGI